MARRFWLTIWWDGTNFASMVVNRTPLLTGGAAVLTPQAFHVHGDRIVFQVPASALGNPGTFGFVATTLMWTTSPIAISSPSHYAMLNGTSNFTYQPSYEAQYPCSYAVQPPGVPECYTTWP